MRRRVLPVVLALGLASPALPAAAATPAQVTAPSISFTAPSSVRAGALLTVTGAVRPAVYGRSVQLWEQRGNGWVAVADTYQSHTGTFAMRVRADTVGRHNYRTVTTDPRVTKLPYSVRGRTQTITTTPSAHVPTTHLADVTPLGAVVGFYGAPYSGIIDPNFPKSRTPSTAIGTRRLAGRDYPKSLETTSRALSWALGADAGTFSAAIGLLDAKYDMPVHGPRVVEVRVDGRLRLRRSVVPNDVFAVNVDVRSARTVTITAKPDGWEPNPTPSDLVIATPVIVSRVLPERSVDPGTALSELHPTSVTGVLLNQGIGYETLLGGSLVTTGPAPEAAGSVEYALGSRFKTLTASPATYVGISGPPVQGHIEVYGDGRLLASLPVPTVGIGPRRSVDVTGVRALRLRFTAQDGPPGLQLALGDPRLT